MRAGAKAGRAHQSDLRAALDLLAWFDVEAVEVAVPGLVSGRVGDDDQTAIALFVPVRLEDFTAVGGEDRRSLWGRDVETAVAAWRQSVDCAEVRGDLAARGPDAVELDNQWPH